MATDRQASVLFRVVSICLSGFRKLLRCVVDHRIIEKSIDGPQADRVHDGVWVTREGNLTGIAASSAIFVVFRAILSAHRVSRSSSSE